jgi:hypothetical protein
VAKDLRPPFEIRLEGEDRNKVGLRNIMNDETAYSFRDLESRYICKLSTEAPSLRLNGCAVLWGLATSACYAAQ